MVMEEQVERERKMNMAFVRNKLREQVQAEEKYAKEMAVVKSGNRTFAHTVHRINPRSKVNMYVGRGVSEQLGVAQRAA